MAVLFLNSIKNTRAYSVGQPFRDPKTVAAHALKPLLKYLFSKLDLASFFSKPWKMVSGKLCILDASLKIYFIISSDSDSNIPEVIVISPLWSIIACRA